MTCLHILNTAVARNGLTIWKRKSLWLRAPFTESEIMAYSINFLFLIWDEGITQQEWLQTLVFSSSNTDLDQWLIFGYTHLDGKPRLFISFCFCSKLLPKSFLKFIQKMVLQYFYSIKMGSIQPFPLAEKKSFTPIQL